MLEKNRKYKYKVDNTSKALRIFTIDYHYAVAFRYLTEVMLHEESALRWLVGRGEF